LAITILLLVSFVLIILTISLLEFFETFHIDDTERAMMESATKLSLIVREYNDQTMLLESTDQLKAKSSRVPKYMSNDSVWMSDSTDKQLLDLERDWSDAEADLQKVLTENENVKKQMLLPNTDMEVMIVGTPIPSVDGAVFVYQSLEVVEQTKAET